MIALLEPRPLHQGPLDVMWCPRCRVSRWHSVPVELIRPAAEPLWGIAPAERNGQGGYGVTIWEWRAVESTGRTGSEACCMICGTWRRRVMPSTVLQMEAR